MSATTLSREEENALVIGTEVNYTAGGKSVRTAITGASTQGKWKIQVGNEEKKILLSDHPIVYDGNKSKWRKLIALKTARAGRQGASKTSKAWVFVNENDQVIDIDSMIGGEGGGGEGGGEDGDFNPQVDELMELNLDEAWEGVNHDDENGVQKYLQLVQTGMLTATRKLHTRAHDAILHVQKKQIVDELGRAEGMLSDEYEEKYLSVCSQLQEVNASRDALPVREGAGGRRLRIRSEMDEEIKELEAQKREIEAAIEKKQDEVKKSVDASYTSRKNMLAIRSLGGTPKKARTNHTVFNEQNQVKCNLAWTREESEGEVGE